MKDPERLLQRGGTDVERSLLRAGANEEPSDRAMHRAAAAIGVAVGLSATATGTAAATAVGKVGFWTTFKWVGTAALVIGGISLGAHRINEVNAPQGVITTQVPARVGADETLGGAPVPAEADRAEEADAIEAQTPAEESVNSKPGARARAKRSATEVPSDPAASIREQTAMIDAARRQLRAGNPGGAVAELDRYHRKYKHGMFGQEAVMLRIEALSRSGNRSAARQLAKRFLASKPSSQYAKRIESLVGPIE
jgi:hypothetical protein